ncbi:MAG: AsmA family protein [Deltaproteobacteria bacterium]|nr:AsmA family protein [Deltaproteobacteria bacterium]
MRLKWILGIAVALMLALIVTIYAIVSSYDFNDLKPRIVQAVKDATGRELTLGGDIELDIGLTPALVVEDVSFQNAPWGSRTELAKIRRLEVQVHVLPLISGTIEVKRLILIEPDILIETNSSGKSNFVFEAPKEMEFEKSKEEATADGEATIPELIFSDVRIENGRLTYKDGQSGKTHLMALDRLAAAASTDKPIKLKLEGTYNSKPVQIRGIFGPLVALTDLNQAWSVNVTANAAGANLTADGAIRDILNGKGLYLAVTVEGKSVPDFFQLFDVTGVPELGPFKVSGRLADPDGKLTARNLDLRVGTEELARVDLKGVVKDLLALRGMELGFAIKGKDLVNLEKITGQTLPFKGPFDFCGHAVASSVEDYKISDLKLVLEKGDLSGSMEINLTGKLPRITAALLSQRLDLRPLLLKERGEDEEAGEDNSTAQPAVRAAKHDKIFSDDPLRLEGLNQANADIRIRAEQLVFPLLTINDVNGHMVLEDGHLTMEPLKFLMGGGNFDGRFSVHPQGKIPAVAMTFKIDQLDLGRMFKDLGVDDLPEGKVDVDIDLEGRGNSVAALMAGLKGKTVIIVQDGRMTYKLIGFLGGDLTSSLLEFLNPFKKDEKYSKLNCFVTGLDIRDGLAQSTVLVLDTGSVTVAGHGKIDLKTEELDLSLKSSPKKGVGLKGIAKLGLSLGKLTETLKLSGTLANPSVGIDPTGSVITIGKAIGGVALFGPFGIAAVLADGKLGDKNPCLAAIEAAKKGGKDSGKEPDKKEGVTR